MKQWGKGFPLLPKIGEDRNQSSSNERTCFWSSTCRRNHKIDDEELSTGKDDDEGTLSNDEEETSSEEGSEDEPFEGEDDDDDSRSNEDDDEGIIGQIFREIRNGTYDPKKKRKRFEEQSRPHSGRVVTVNSSYLKDEDGSDRATRGDCVMSTTEALHRLTHNEKDEMNKGDEWLIIKVPRNQRLKYFMVDYCDGDNEDEYHWLEGPYLQKDWAIRDLLAQKMLPRGRTVRRRQGRTEFRNDEQLDKRNIHGRLLPESRPRPHPPPPPSLCFLCHPEEEEASNSDEEENPKLRSAHPI